MVSLGSKLGLYQAMAGAGPLSAREVATRAGAPHDEARSLHRKQGLARTAWMTEDC